MKDLILLFFFLVSSCLKSIAQTEYRYDGDHYYEHIELYRNKEFYLEIYQSMSIAGYWGYWTQKDDTIKLNFYPRITPKIRAKHKKKKKNNTLSMDKKSFSLLSINNLSMYLHLEDNSIMKINIENYSQVKLDKRIKGIFLKTINEGDTYIYQYIEKKANIYEIELITKKLDMQINYIYKNDCIIPLDKEGLKKYKLRKIEVAL